MENVVQVLLLLAVIVAVIVIIALAAQSNHRQPGEGQIQSTPPRVEQYSILNSRYEVENRPVKHGGMSDIWMARDNFTSTPCVIKTPRRGTNLDEIFLKQLHSETSYLKRFNHPNIVRYVDDFYSCNEFHLVLEYIKGENAIAAVSRSSASETKVLSWALQILDALAYIHRLGIIHRDVNPKNLILQSDGSVKLIDFGTAKMVSESDGNSVMTDPFTNIANRGFDIPELYLGSHADQRADICGVAQSCIYLLTVRQPNDICSSLFAAGWPRTVSESSRLADHIAGVGVTRRTARCLAQGMMFDAGNRFASARAMQDALTG